MAFLFRTNTYLHHTRHSKPNPVVSDVTRAVFKYDTVHGVYDGTVENYDRNFIVDGKIIKACMNVPPEILLV